MSALRVAVLGGDGIGPEVTRAAVAVLRRTGELFGCAFHFEDALVGGAALAVEGVAISDATMALCARADAILFGAVGGADVHAAVRPESALLRLRRDFELYANLRPVRCYGPLAAVSPLKPSVIAGTDLLFVRELTGGLYFGRPSEICEGPAGREAVDTLAYTAAEIARVARKAFDLAAGRRQKVTSVDKANVLSSSRLWREVVDAVAAEYAGIRCVHQLVDSCAMELIRQPAAFDVLVTENMFGDILTDEASMIAGSLGLLPSASLGTRATAHGVFGMYEPIHGSAPDLAGQDVANPLGAILSAAMLLRYSGGMPAAASAVERAVDAVLDGPNRTRDIAAAGDAVVGTRRMGELVLEALGG